MKVPVGLTLLAFVAQCVLADVAAPKLSANSIVKQSSAGPPTGLLEMGATKGAPGSNGWGYSFSGAVHEIKESFYVAIIGCIMCCISFPCLYWNEGRCVTREKTLGKAREEAIVIAEEVDTAYKAATEHTTKLVHLHGRPRVTVNQQCDTQFGVTSGIGEHAKRVERTVEMYQWITQSHTERRATDRFNSQGEREYEDVRVVDPPRLGWGPTPPNQAELPSGILNPESYRNDHPAGFSTAPFKQGTVKLGPYGLSLGMIDGEMATVTTTLEVDLDAIKNVIENGFTLPEGEPEDETAKAGDDDTAKDEGGEDTGLLSKGGSGHGYGSGASGPTLDLSSTSKKFLQSCDELNVSGTSLRTYEGEPQHHDYQISWKSLKLPATGGQVDTHTVLAQQVLDSYGAFQLMSWEPEGIEDFEIDRCWGYVCPCGYKFVAEPPEGVGCISCIDAAMFPNASSDADQDDLEAGGLTGSVALTNSAGNSKKVEKLVAGEVSVGDIISGMEAMEPIPNPILLLVVDANAEKTTFYRKCGFLLMFLGFQCMMDPFPTLFHFIPLVGHAVGFIVWIAISIAACALGCFGSVTTISVAWLRYRPLWGILGIMVAGGIAFTVVNLKI